MEKKKIALVCGGKSGLGEGIAKALLEADVQVLSTSSQASNSTEIIDSPIHLDMGDASSVDTCIETLARSKMMPDILVVNGPGPKSGSFAQVDQAAWDEAYKFLWSSPVRLVKGVLPAMIERKWGRVIWVTSISCEHYVPNLVLSTSLRAGIHGLIRTLSAEYAHEGVTFNAIAPGYHGTNRMRQLGITDKVIGKIPVGRVGTVEEFGASAAFLASPLAGYITGQVLLCDGGASHGK